jgi:excisionase family DNA binding protein
MKLLTAKEVSEIIGCSAKTIYSWAETRHEGFPVYKFGKGRKSLIRFKPDEIEQWIQKCRVKDE